jgi:hypothetical protein
MEDKTETPSVEEIEKMLKGSTWEGDAAEARTLGGGEAIAKQRKSRRLWSILTPVLACLVLLSIAVPLTYHFAKAENTTQAGAGPTDSPISYIKEYSTNIYYYPIYSLTGGGKAFGGLFYSYNSENDEHLTIHLLYQTAQSIEVFDSAGNPFLYTKEANSQYGFSGMSVFFKANVVSESGDVVTFGPMTLDVSPYFNWIESQKK